MVKTVIILLILAFLTIGSAEARDEIRIVGSATVLPFVRTVTENFAAAGNFPPSVETTGTGNGFRLFCDGIGFEHPDINATARPMTKAEEAECSENGVTAIIEMVIGLDGLVFANSKKSPQYNFSTAQIFSALAERIEIGGEIKKNPFVTWNEIDPSLASQPIKVMGPPHASGFYDAFMELIMERGGTSFPAIAALDQTQRYAVSRTLRKDGKYIESPRDEYYILDWLRKHSDAFGVIPVSLLGNHTGFLKPNKIDDVMPTPDTIANGRYPLSRPIYLYIKRKHVDAVKGLQKFLYESTSEKAIGPEGYLSETGFIPLNDRGRNQARSLALSLSPMSR
jgi:phosphate transport system substrate-binding protein